MNNYTVYKHTSPNGKIYIGITGKNPKHRWSNGNAYSNNKYFTNAINKYGWDNFTHEILFENLTKEAACQKEIELIKEYKSNNSEFGYNQSSGGEHSYFGCKHTQEQKQKIGLTHKNRIWVNNGEFSRMIYNYELDNYIQLGFNVGRIPHSEQARKNMSEAQKGHTVSIQGRLNMSLARIGKPHPHKCGYRVYKDGYKPSISSENCSKAGKGRVWLNNGIKCVRAYPDKVKEYLDKGFVIGKIQRWKNKENLGKNTNKLVNQYDLEGNFIKQWCSLTDAANYYNICISSITNCCKGKTLKANNFIWKYSEKENK